MKKEKSFKNKQELIDAALDEFSEKGYENASLNNILKKAGISKGSFYHHFKDKGDLYLYLANVLAEKKKEFFGTYIKPEEYNRDIFTMLRIFTQAGLEFARRNPSIARFSNSFLKERGNAIYDRCLREFDFQSNRYLDSLIDGAYEKGDLREDLPRDFVRRLIAYLFMHLHDIADIAGIDELENAANNLIEFIKNGLSRRR